ncbi:metallophosphoesterase [Hanstruepera marina]|uniref:metallophosphoesterase n=1 Tax=Hanstruepera marina TaxID=2873265 RepID=UPI001CA65A37|nr:metallophosphoesterase [Hanstruepera marina]
MIKQKSRSFFKKAYSLLLFVWVLSCATFKPQYADENKKVSSVDNLNPIEHQFYLIGDAGYSPLNDQALALKHLEEVLKTASSNSTTIFLGDNIYQKGLPKKGHKNRVQAEHNINAQLQTVENYKGSTIFIPGNHDWYSNGLKGLERQEDYIDDALGKNTFLPEHGCPIEHKTISDNIELIIVDSKWYLTNWDNHPTMNDECQIKTREAFFDEFESRIKKARGKTTIVAIHHPMFSNGPHGGKYSFKEHMKPIPVLGTLKNVLRKTTGVSPEDFQNERYNEFRKRIITLAQYNDRVIFTSGHEHSLQYLETDNLVQIISGSGSKKSATNNGGGGLFSFGEYGFARLDIYKDGSSSVTFFDSKNKEIVFNTQVFKALNNQQIETYNIPESPIVEKSIYSKEETDKSGFYKWLWGSRYRADYSQNIKVQVVNLDTLMGGLIPVRKGGGQQSNSLRLANKQGQEFVMRGLRKDALKYIQAAAFKDQYIEGQFSDTYTQNLILDVFSGAHPYAPFVVGYLSDALNIYHTNPKLYFVPKQKALEPYNDDFGDELYMIEEHAGDNHGDKASFGYSNELISTKDMLEEVRSDEDIDVDEELYIRARLFDMVIGDWDRHEDQWRWAEFKVDGKTIYKPFPRDRDQAFSIMSDGLLLGLAVKLVPASKPLKSYDYGISNVKAFNFTPYPLDMALINDADKKVWNTQIEYIKSHLTDEVIESAFYQMPQEVNQESIELIKKKLIHRRNNLEEFADEYFDVINKFAVVKGTDKDDWFDIIRKPNGETEVVGYRIKDDKKADIFHRRTYNKKHTKEIWIYALDDDDVFYVSGEGNSVINVRLIGGQNNDVYDIHNGKKIHVYDFKSKPNTIKTNKGNLKLIDDYETNVYNYLKLKNNTNQILPIIGFNPDDGLKLGILDTYTAYGFERNPFSSQHTFSGAYYFATSGYDLKYNGEFANVIGRFNLGLEAVFTSPNYTINFFGYGNETENPNTNGQDLSLDYNRVKLRTIKFAPSLIKKGELGSEAKLELSYQSIEVEETQGRFINDFYDSNEIENTNNFFGVELSYYFRNADNLAYPSLGFTADFKLGYLNNIDKNANMGYFIPSIGVDYKLDAQGKLVLASKVKGHITYGNSYEFYQAASIGASDGLRGYRNQRFTGKHAYYQLTDLRYIFSKLKTGLLPVNLGVYGGFDYGRVWLSNDTSNVWHNSYGGGVFVVAAELFTINTSLFNGNDGMRFALALGLNF